MSRLNLPAISLAYLLGAVLSGCGGGSPSSPPPPPPAISVAVSPNTATVQAGSTEQLVATVANDSGNAGVSWTVSCSSGTCGTVSPGVTPSGGATTYTPPTTLPSGNVTINVTATSVADKSKSSSATLIPVGHIASYEVGVDYHSTGIDIDATGFVAAYNNAQVRQTVQMQLQGMADRGATFIHTSMWVAKTPGQTCCSNAQITFPMTDPEAANLRTYAQDVASIQSAAGNRLRLDLALMWGGVGLYRRIAFGRPRNTRHQRNRVRFERSGDYRSGTQSCKRRDSPGWCPYSGHYFLRLRSDNRELVEQQTKRGLAADDKLSTIRVGCFCLRAQAGCLFHC